MKYAIKISLSYDYKPHTDIYTTLEERDQAFENLCDGIKYSDIKMIITKDERIIINMSHIVAIEKIDFNDEEF